VDQERKKEKKNARALTDVRVAIEKRKRTLLRWIKYRKLDKDPDVNKVRKQGKLHAVRKK
jgi:hypothetical protein